MSSESATSHDAAIPSGGAFAAFLGVAGAGYLVLLVFVFAYGLYGERLTAGVDVACAEAAYQNGKQLEEKGNYDLAIQRYRQALEGRFADNVRESECARSIGEVLLKLGRFEEAVDAFREVKPEAFTEPGHWTGYVAALFRVGHDEEAERLGKVWLEAADAANDRQQKVWAHATLGQLYERANRLDEALAQFRVASDLEPEGHVCVLMARTLQRLGKVEEAIQQLDAFLARVKSGPLHEDAQQLRAELQRQRNPPRPESPAGS